MNDPWLLGLAFVVGSAVGSFLNVCIARLPQGKSIVFPPSACPHCGTPIRPWDNVPILSFLWLRGRCRACGKPISWRYPLVEFLTGALCVANVVSFGVTAWAVVASALTAALVVVTFIDLDHQIIPDVVSLPGIGIGLATALAGWGPSLLDRVVGVLLGGGLLWAVAVFYEWVRNQEGMGGGDIKLLAMIGAFLGWRGVLVTLLVGSLTGALVGGGRIALRRADPGVPIPFGPFLALGAVVALYWGEAVMAWYIEFAAGVRP
ncbi:MAG: type 4 prepilin-like proteins leader peptide-processing enzyme [Candidatus Binatia bacterium]|nr:MAG: type 4 prepilin-like proteins leader peptide-processing enzyme [Candidatus Binatia bacterium]